MFTKLPLNSRRHLAASTLTDYVMSLGIGGVMVTVLCGLFFHSSRSFATFYNLLDSDQASSRAMNQMVKDFRMVSSVTNFTSTSISMLDWGGKPLSYTYDPSTKILTRNNGGTNSILMRDCTRLEFIVQQRNMTNDTYDFFTTTNAVECKAITVNWVRETTLMGRVREDMPQTITLVVRN